MSAKASDHWQTREAEVDAIKTYVGPLIVRNGITSAMSFRALLRDAREATGRNVDTGELEHPERAGVWLGAVGYLILLDQIGTAVKPEGEVSNPDRSVHEALRHFAADLTTESDRDVVYALRTRSRTTTACSTRIGAGEST